MKIIKETFGCFTEYILSNPETGEAVNILPEFGGLIRRMTLQKDGSLFTVIDSAVNDEQLINSMAAYPAAHLFPWGNRVRNGRYYFEGNSYQLPINEIALNNAIHGFVAFANFEVVDEKTEDDKAILVIRFQYKGNHFGYPFAFVLEITNTLSATDGFTLTYTIKNTGNKRMPMALGWHPYFKIAGETANDWHIDFPATEQCIPDQQMISVERKPVDFRGGIALNNQTLDAVFAVEPANKIKAVLHSPKKNVSINVWQDGLVGQFTFMVVYIPPSRNCVAIEPMTGNTNAYNSGDGLQTLPAGGSYQVSCGVFFIIKQKGRSY